MFFYSYTKGQLIFHLIILDCIQARIFKYFNALILAYEKGISDLKQIHIRCDHTINIIIILQSSSSMSSFRETDKSSDTINDLAESSRLLAWTQTICMLKWNGPRLFPPSAVCTSTKLICPELQFSMSSVRVFVPRLGYALCLFIYARCFVFPSSSSSSSSSSSVICACARVACVFSDLAGRLNRRPNTGNFSYYCSKVIFMCRMHRVSVRVRERERGRERHTLIEGNRKTLLCARKMGQQSKTMQNQM